MAEQVIDLIIALWRQLITDNHREKIRPEFILPINGGIVYITSGFLTTGSTSHCGKTEVVSTAAIITF